MSSFLMVEKAKWHHFPSLWLFFFHSYFCTKNFEMGTCLVPLVTIVGQFDDLTNRWEVDSTLLGETIQSSHSLSSHLHTVPQLIVFWHPLEKQTEWQHSYFQKNPSLNMMKNKATEQHCGDQPILLNDCRQVIYSLRLSISSFVKGGFWNH